ncbi:MAG TPA: hypothetical protein VFQ60_00845 [Patescibacteria group bacterium]|nr:hypothetical protein [Patescibacteria group bacterium]
MTLNQFSMHEDVKAKHTLACAGILISLVAISITGTGLLLAHVPNRYATGLHPWSGHFFWITVGLGGILTLFMWAEDHWGDLLHAFEVVRSSPKRRR